MARASPTSPRDHILRFGEKDNFWEMGETGPCGPCSEIHIDRGPGACDRQDVPATLCGERGLRALHRALEPGLHPVQPRRRPAALDELPAKHVDTGMGLERITAVLQGVRRTTTPISSGTSSRSPRRIAGQALRATSRRRRLVPRHRRPRPRAHVHDRRRRPCRRTRAAATCCAASCAARARHGKHARHSTSRSCTRSSARSSTRSAPPTRSSHAASATIAEVVRSEEERFAETLDRGLAVLEEEVEQHAADGAKRAARRGRLQALRHLRLPARPHRGHPARRAASTVDARRLRARDGRAARARGRAGCDDATAGPRASCPAAASRALRRRPRRRGRSPRSLALLADGAETRGRREGDRGRRDRRRRRPSTRESGGQVGDRGAIETDERRRASRSRDTQKPRGTAVTVHAGDVVRQGARRASATRVRLRDRPRAPRRRRA